MRFLRRKRKADEVSESLCAICREPMPDDAIECNMCGAPAVRVEAKRIERQDQGTRSGLTFR
jgi:hypothetical protein